MTPGLHSIPSEQYHKAAGVSRSALEWIAAPKTPAHFRAKFIDKLIPDEESPALTMGTLVHRCLLEPETMDGALYVKPEGMTFTTKEGRAWRDSHEDKPIVSAADSAAILGMRESVWAHPVASKILKSSEFERSAFADDKGMLLKARFDALPKAGNVIADLKTIERADLESVEKAVFSYGYFRQAAFYLKVANLIGLERELFVFIFVEKTPPYAVACYTPIDTVLEAGRLLIERDLQLLRNCYAENHWPGYSAGVTPCALPQWAMKQLEAVV